MRARELIGALGALAILLGGCGGQSQGSGTTAADPLDDVSGEELFRRGQVLTRAGDFVRAEQYYAAAMHNGFPEDRVMPALMQACVEADRLVAALTYAEPYLERHPTQWSLRLLVASIHMGLEHDTQAHAHLERVLETAPEEPPEAHYFLGVLYRDRLEDREAATRHFARYLALAPDGPHTEEAQASIPSSVLSIPVRVDEAGEPLDEEPPAEAATGGADDTHDDESAADDDMGSAPNETETE